MSKVVVIGSSNTDMVVKTRKFPLPGETILGGNFFMFSGGKGANQAVAAARMNAQVTLVCKTGDDIFGKNVREQLKQEGIVTEYIQTSSKEPSGTALILIDEKGENEIVVASGANNTLNEQDVELAMNVIETADIVLLQLEIPVASVVYTAKKSFHLGKKVILNPAPAQQLPADLFACLYLITPNETEAEILTGIKVMSAETAANAAQKLIEMGVENVIITLGAKGAYFKNRFSEIHVPSTKVNAVDTTAAGDVFNGVLAVCITSGKNWEESISIACRAAAISVTRMGAQQSMPYYKEIEEFVK